MFCGVGLSGKGRKVAAGLLCVVFRCACDG